MPRDERSGRFVPGQPQSRSRRTHSSARASAQRGGAGMKTTLGLLAGAGIGAGLMYLFDPYEGARRRQQLADAAAAAAESAGETLGGAWESVSETASHAGSALASHLPGLPSAADLRRQGQRAATVAQEKASGWLDSARSALPSMPSYPQRRRPTGLSATTAGIGGLGLIALSVGAMWLLDPALGRSRRAW